MQYIVYLTKEQRQLMKDLKEKKGINWQYEIRNKIKEIIENETNKKI